MRIVSLIQPSELGSDFKFDVESGIWKVNFPAGGGGGGSELSKDSNNALKLGVDGGVYLDAALLNAYAMVQDNVSQKIHLYSFPAGTDFDLESAILVSSVNLIEMTGIFDDVAIDGEVITFTDADTGLTLTLDTANLQLISGIVAGPGIDVTSVNGTTTISVLVDPNPENAIQLTDAGLFVPGGEDQVNPKQTLSVVETGLCHVVGSSHLVMPQVELVDLIGNSIGYVHDLSGGPVSSTTEGPEHCVEWVGGLTAPNCKIDKVANGLPDDIFYANAADGVISWYIHVNGVDTGYIATDGTDENLSNEVEKQGKLEDVLPLAAASLIGSAHGYSGLMMWNLVNKQTMLTLVPTKPIVISDIVKDGYPLRLTEWTSEQLAKHQESDPYTTLTGVPNWDDYFDPEKGVINFCLAPATTSGGGVDCSKALDDIFIALDGNFDIIVDGSSVGVNLELTKLKELANIYGLHIELEKIACENTTNRRLYWLNDLQFPEDSYLELNGVKVTDWDSEEFYKQPLLKIEKSAYGLSFENRDSSCANVAVVAPTGNFDTLQECGFSTDLIVGTIPQEVIMNRLGVSFQLAPLIMPDGPLSVSTAWFNEAGYMLSSIDAVNPGDLVTIKFYASGEILDYKDFQISVDGEVKNLGKGDWVAFDIIIPPNPTWNAISYLPEINVLDNGHEVQLTTVEITVTQGMIDVSKPLVMNCDDGPDIVEGPRSGYVTGYLFSTETVLKPGMKIKITADPTYVGVVVKPNSSLNDFVNPQFTTLGVFDSEGVVEFHMPEFMYGTTSNQAAFIFMPAESDGFENNFRMAAGFTTETTSLQFYTLDGTPLNGKFNGRVNLGYPTLEVRGIPTGTTQVILEKGNSMGPNGTQPADQATTINAPNFLWMPSTPSMEYDYLHGKWGVDTNLILARITKDGNEYKFYTYIDVVVTA